jgi:nicotinate phosphoribosyltransferase
MMQGYHFHKVNPRVVFDMFFRRQPFGGGYAVLAGIEPLIDALETLRFEPRDLDYLRSTGLFRDDFLDELVHLRFGGDVYALPEGSVVFANEPLLRVHADLIEAQLIESLLLNIVNFQTLIATKAARIYLATGEGTLLEFGLRRAHGPDGALSASRAAYIGGAAATSNTLAGQRLGIPVSGTMAHSWIMAFADELEAFRRYAEVFPDSCILLIDTYDTLGSGIRNAIVVGRELKDGGHKGFGVRLDSGDLVPLSREVRRCLNSAGLSDARIAVSNDLDEGSIGSLRAAGAPIDLWGVGTNLVTAGGDPALSGVYKLVARSQGSGYQPVMKRSDDPAKTSDPGIKQLYRIYDGQGRPRADYIALEEESPPKGGGLEAFDPVDEKPRMLKTLVPPSPMLRQVMSSGKRYGQREPLPETRDRTLTSLRALPEEVRRLDDPVRYPVLVSATLRQTRELLLRSVPGGDGHGRPSA